ncbi:MAG: GNAT family N-acetyltransferase [Arachnia sp.]
MNTIRIAEEQDLAGLMALEESFPEAQRWSEESWLGELNGPGRHILVCQGVSGLDAAATFSLCEDVVDLHRIVTRVSARRRGIARQMVTAGMSWAHSEGAARMLLEVEATNTAALSLYEGAAFHRIAERRNYYGPGLHAVILQRRIQALNMAMAEGEFS